MVLRNTLNLVIELEILGLGENEVIQEKEYKRGYGLGTR